MTGLDTFAYFYFLVTEFYALSPSNSSKRTMKNQMVKRMVWMMVNVKYRKSTFVSTTSNRKK